MNEDSGPDSSNLEEPRSLSQYLRTEVEALRSLLRRRRTPTSEEQPASEKRDEDDGPDGENDASDPDISSP